MQKQTKQMLLNILDYRYSTSAIINSISILIFIQYFNYFLEDSYRIKKKEIDIKKIKDELIKNNLIFL